MWRRWLWRPVGMGGAVRQGLDFAQVNAALEGMGIDRAEWPAIYDRLEFMEAEALEGLAAQAQRG